MISTTGARNFTSGGTQTCIGWDPSPFLHVSSTSSCTKIYIVWGIFTLGGEFLHRVGSFSSGGNSYIGG